MAGDTAKAIRRFADLGFDEEKVLVNCGVMQGWADALEAAEAKIERAEQRARNANRDFDMREAAIVAHQQVLEAAEKRVAELEASEKALLDAHARRGARVAELEAQLIEVNEKTIAHLKAVNARLESIANRQPEDNADGK